MFNFLKEPIAIGTLAGIIVGVIVGKVSESFFPCSFTPHIPLVFAVSSYWIVLGIALIYEAKNAKKDRW